MKAALDLTVEQATVTRFVANGLLTPFADPVTAAAHLAGVQAQILPAAGLALWNRVPAFTATQLDHLLYHERALVRLWGQRGTLHLYAATDWPLIYAAQAGRSTYWEQEALRDGWDPAEYEAFIERAARWLAEHETMGRSDLRRLAPDIDDRHLSGWGGIFAILTRRGLACHAAPSGGEARMAHRLRWRPDLPWDPPSTEEANAELMRRYIAVFGPVSFADMTAWRGRTQAEIKRWLARLGDEVVQVTVGGRPAWWLQSCLERLPALPEPGDLPPRLLGRFDPLLLGTRDRSWLIDAAVYKHVWRPAGHIEATILLQGRIAGTWRYDWRGPALIVTLRPFAPLSAATRAQLAALAADVAAHFAAPLGECRWEE
ncbi:winged helix DNA-binding domain-containing protein [Chloroflexus sp.]|uniref:winged helix DNA-binding domain-containing protein n=1 Tax=Chloroflexus sp. TaxID=1904827 RepID=UPI0029FB6869|nr:winged helix DNA-binding domain-containing protein [Chloroflexus sp.]MCS6886957.1 winged helix DNA-binding domain-containing protein [Chloroflexus sp.]